MLDEARAIARALQGIQATMGWLELRGIKRSEVLRILKIAEDAGRDVSEGEIIQVLDATDTELLNLRQKIAMARRIDISEVGMDDLIEARAADTEAEDAPEPPVKKAAKPAAKKGDEPTAEEVAAALKKAEDDAKANKK